MRPHALLLSLLAACGAEPGTEEPVPARPNVVLISIDSLRADHLGCYGYERDTSPAIDALAAEGALFETVVSSTSWTLPAHAAMFTGLPDSVHGADRAGRALAADRTTLAEALGAEGYRTAGFWSGPYLHPGFGLGQGFDEYVSCTGYAIEGGAGDPLMHGRSHADVTSPRLLAAAEEWLRAPRGEEPFFLFVHMWDVHYDYTPPEPWASRFDPDYDGPVDGRGLGHNPDLQRNGLPPRDLEHLVALYDGEIAWTDLHVGRLLGLLAELGLADDTLVVLTADHGEEFFEHGRFGHRRTLYEESIRVPLVVRLPGVVPAGLRVEEPARMVDLAPTILDLCGAPPLEVVLGRSLAPRLRGEPASDALPAAVSELVPARRPPLRALRTERYKTLLDPETGAPTTTFDLARDPEELRDLGAAGAAAAGLEREAAALEAELARLRARLGRAGEGEVPSEVEDELRALGYLDPAAD